MASERNRIVELTDYLESCGIEVNIGKNRARGNRGFFKVVGSNFRIDIAKGQSEDAILGALAHEFAHFVHYKYDKTLKSLDFVFDVDENLTEELLRVTVDMIPRTSVQPLFDAKANIKSELKLLVESIKRLYPEFRQDTPCKLIEQKISKTPLKYLLKYDRVNVLENGICKIYSVDTLTLDTEQELYLKIKSKQRALGRINSKITRLNRYYNSPTELFARSFELFAVDKERLKQIAPNVYTDYEKILKEERIPQLSTFVKKI